ncbi:MAG: LamB/YcsF family protein [Desulfohalobiaceae bacterium]|nr:LamB/YcsF family protein [Desulfohalobiaceae bacterium]
MRGIDVNCDMGESFGPYTLGRDSEVMPHITSANVACGWHAGDPSVMDRTVALAAQNGVSVGAHPGYPDLLGFGRRKLDCSPDDLTQYIIYQVGALQAFCHKHGTPLQHVKPHGALYHAVLEDEELGRAVARAVLQVDPGLVLVTLAGPKGESMSSICREMGLDVAREAFPDRAYNADGTLVPRGSRGAVIEDPQEVAARTHSLARDNSVRAASGETIELEAHTVCVHGDTPTAVELVREIGHRLQDDGLQLRHMAQLTN